MIDPDDIDDADLSIVIKHQRLDAVAANEAFCAAMNKAIKRGRETVKPGTYVDKTPLFGRRMYGEAASSSSCGSPAAMCFDSGGSRAGAQTMK